MKLDDWACIRTYFGLIRLNIESSVSFVFWICMMLKDSFVDFSIQVCHRMPFVRNDVLEV